MTRKLRIGDKAMVRNFNKGDILELVTIDSIGDKNDRPLIGFNTDAKGCGDWCYLAEVEFVIIDGVKHWNR